MVLLVEHSNLTMKTLYGINGVFKILILSQMIGYVYGMVLIAIKKKN